MHGLNEFEVNQDLFGGFCLEKKTKQNTNTFGLGST